MPYENKRRMEEQLFVDNLRFIFTDTAKEYLDARMGRIQGVIEKVQGELKATADKAVAELIEKKTKERWFRKSTGKLLGIFERKISIDKKRTLQDYEIFKSQGVDGLVRAMMKGDVDQMVRKKYGVMALTPAMQAEVDAKLKEIAGSELATNMTVQMLAWSYRLGKRPGANEAMYLEKRNPGRLLQGFESDDGFKVQMQELINKGAVQEPKHFWQNISRFFSGGMTGVPATP